MSIKSYSEYYNDSIISQESDIIIAIATGNQIIFIVFLFSNKKSIYL